MRPVSEFNFTTPVREARASGVRIGDLMVQATGSTPMRAKTFVEPHVAFSLPFAGSGKIIQGAKIVEWDTSKPIVSNSFDRPMDFVNDTISMMTLRPSLNGLRSSLRSVIADKGLKDACAEDICARLMVRGPVMDLGRSWSVDYYAALMNIAALIDSCNSDEALLTRIGVEEVVNGLLAHLVLDQESGSAVEDGPHHVPRSARAIELICDTIRGRTGRFLSMSEMEDLTGLSGRALNYAFRARFDCSPQEWQRNFLLDHARRMLLDSGSVGSVKALAYELGFSTASSFAAFYRQRFGERPSDTLSRGAPFAKWGRLEQGQ